MTKLQVRTEGQAADREADMAVASYGNYRLVEDDRVVTAMPPTDVKEIWAGPEAPVTVTLSDGETVHGHAVRSTSAGWQVIELLKGVNRRQRSVRMIDVDYIKPQAQGDGDA